MNEITLVKVFSKDETFSNKWGYKSIIYCFCGELQVGFGNSERVLHGGQFLSLNGSSICKTADNTEFYYMEVKGGSFKTSTDLMTDGETKPLLFCLKEALRCFDVGGTVMEGLGTLIAGYIGEDVAGESTGVTEEIKKTINENIGNADFKLDQYLKNISYSQNYLKKLFKSRTGYTPKEYLTYKRMNKARALLSGADRMNYTVKRVASLCGYADPLYFSRLFKKRFSLSPLAYAHRFDKPASKRAQVGSLIEDDQ